MIKRLFAGARHGWTKPEKVHGLNVIGWCTRHGWSIVLGCFLGVVCFPVLVAACDVNLVSIITGENPNDAFSQMIIRLASETRSVGQAVDKPELAKENMTRLMKTWVDFDNRFSQTPPEWAKSDQEWNNKIKSLADEIGKIQRELGSLKEEKMHEQILYLSERIMNLLDAMPMTKEKKVLIGIFRRFVALSEGIELNDAKKFGENLAALNEGFKAFRTGLATESMVVTGDAFFLVDQLQKVFKNASETLQPMVKENFRNAEIAFKGMNEKLLKTMK